MRSGKYKDPNDAFQHGANLREEADRANVAKQGERAARASNGGSRNQEAHDESPGVQAPRWRDHAYSAADLKGKTFPEINYVVDQLIVEGLTLLAGRPKVGKSWAALDIANGVASDAPEWRGCQGAWQAVSAARRCSLLRHGR
jgi:hypothetical protein